MIEEHEGKKSEFVWNVVKGFRKPLLRQLTEAVHIKHAGNDKVMNLKSEYFSNEINGIVLNKKEMVCKHCSKKFDKLLDMRDHFKLVHEKLQCSKCEYVSFGRKDMGIHVKYKHA